MHLDGPGEAPLPTVHLTLYFTKLEAMYFGPGSVVQSSAVEMHHFDSVTRQSKLEVIRRVLESFDVSPHLRRVVKAELEHEQPLNPDDGVLRSRHLQNQFYKEKFAVIDPVEVKCENTKSFHYVPIK